jgi:hypothetical protein
VTIVLSKLDERISPAESALTETAFDLVAAYRDACQLDPDEERSISRLLNTRIVSALQEVRDAVGDMRPADW